MPEITPAAALAILTIAITVSGVVLGWVKYRLSDDFARKSELAEVGSTLTKVSARVEAVERHIQTVPTHSDMRALGERIAAVEGSVAVVGAELRGVSAGVARVENDLALIKRHLLEDRNA